MRAEEKWMLTRLLDVDLLKSYLKMAVLQSLLFPGLQVRNVTTHV